jgi:hypothetical protein
MCGANAQATHRPPRRIATSHSPLSASLHQPPMDRVAGRRHAPGSVMPESVAAITYGAGLRHGDDSFSHRDLMDAEDTDQPSDRLVPLAVERSGRAESTAEPGRRDGSACSEESLGGASSRSFMRNTGASSDGSRGRPQFQHRSDPRPRTSQSGHHRARSATVALPPTAHESLGATSPVCGRSRRATQPRPWVR